MDATNHRASLRAEELKRYSKELLAAFRSSTKETKMPSAILLERRFYAMHLQHLASKTYPESLFLLLSIFSNYNYTCATSNNP